MRCSLILITVAAGCFASAAFGQASSSILDSQERRFQEKLDTAVEELSETQARIAVEKLPLVKAARQARADVSMERSAVERLLLHRAEANRLLTQAREEVGQSSQLVDYVDSLASDYLAGSEARWNISEDQLYREDLTRLRGRLAEEPKVRSAAALESRLEVMDLAINRLRNTIGGRSFSGRAVDQSGSYVKGSFVLMGPIAYFGSDDRLRAGIADTEANSLEPILLSTPGLKAEDVWKVVESGEGALPLDASLGGAASMSQARWSWKEHVKRGGPVGYTILAFAAAAVLVAFFKVFDFSRVPLSGAGNGRAVLEAVSDERYDAAVELARKNQASVSSVLERVIQNRDEREEVIEEIVIGEIQKVKRRLERLLPFLAITAATAPLMGLLGTVVGMIKTFALLTVFGSGEAKSLSSGISEALVTTEFGLVVAIPTLIIHGMFIRMSKERVAALEDVASDFVVGVKKLKRRREEGSAGG